MGKLDALLKSFSPKRNFRCSHTQVAVDGILVRPPDGNDQTSWIPIVSADNLVTHYAIRTEDIVQDPRIVRSARVSTGRDTKEVDEKADGLVFFLWRDRHVTPLEGVVFCLRIETPIMYAQPLFRLFASHNEFSGRYSEIDSKYYLPRNIPGNIVPYFYEAEEEARKLYSHFLSRGVAKEMARLVHLYRFYTKFYMTISLRHILEFITLENVPTRHTDTEFWQIKGIFKEIVSCWAPWAFEAYRRMPHTLDFSWVNEARKKNLSGRELDALLEEAPGMRVLNKGLIKTINVYGKEKLVLECLDDFPNPLRAFGHAGMTFYLSLPIHVFRQWVRHRYAHWTELSINFDKVVAEDLFFIPERFREQEGKAGHYTYTDMDDEKNEQITTLFLEHIEKCKERYRNLRMLGLAPELAGLNLPYSFYIPVVLTLPLESMMNFLSLRCDSHAQYETRQYANPVCDQFLKFFPILADIFAKNVHYGDSLKVK